MPTARDSLLSSPSGDKSVLPKNYHEEENSNSSSAISKPLSTKNKQNFKLNDLMIAVQREDYEKCQTMLSDNKISVSQLDVHGYNSLHYSACYNQLSVKILVLLLQHSTCEINKEDSNGFTALDHANGNTSELKSEFINILLARGAKKGAQLLVERCEKEEDDGNLGKISDLDDGWYDHSGLENAGKKRRKFGILNVPDVEIRSLSTSSTSPTSSSTTENQIAFYKKFSKMYIHTATKYENVALLTNFLCSTNGVINTYDFSDEIYNINVLDEYQRNLLHYAALYTKTNTNTIQKLLSHNGGTLYLINKFDCDGLTPLDYAYQNTSKHKDEIIKLIQEKRGCRANDFEYSILEHVATNTHHTYIIEVDELLQKYNEKPKEHRKNIQRDVRKIINTTMMKVFSYNSSINTSRKQQKMAARRNIINNELSPRERLHYYMNQILDYELDLISAQSNINLLIGKLGVNEALSEKVVNKLKCYKQQIETCHKGIVKKKATVREIMSMFDYKKVIWKDFETVARDIKKQIRKQNAMSSSNLANSLLNDISPEVVPCMSKSFDDVNCKGDPFIVACEHNDIIKVKDIIEKSKTATSGKFVNKLGLSANELVESTGLIIATRRENENVVKFLLEQPSIDVCMSTFGGNTALHIACWKNSKNTNTIKMLLNHSQCSLELLNDKNNAGKSPIDYAYKNKSNLKSDILNLLKTKAKTLVAVENGTSFSNMQTPYYSKSFQTMMETTSNRSPPMKEDGTFQNSGHDNRGFRSRSANQEDAKAVSRRRFRSNSRSNSRGKNNATNRRFKSRSPSQDKRSLPLTNRAKRKLPSNFIASSLVKRLLPRINPRIQKSPHVNPPILNVLVENRINKMNAIYAAIRDEDDVAVKRILLDKASLEHFLSWRNNFGDNLLHIAAQYSVISGVIVSLLLTHRAVSLLLLNQTSENGDSPLDKAYENVGKYRDCIIKIISDKGGKRKNVRKMLFSCVQEENLLELMRVLHVEQPDLLAVVNDFGQNILHVAAKCNWKSAAVIQAIVDYQIMKQYTCASIINIRDDEGKTPLDICKIRLVEEKFAINNSVNGDNIFDVVRGLQKILIENGGTSAII
jgi:hypothetical protein